MTAVKPRSIDDEAFNPKALCKRYKRSWETISRWQKDPAVAFPTADFFVARTPYFYLSTLLAWEASNPKSAPDHPIRHARIETRG